MNICYVGHPVSPVSKPLSPVTYHATAAPCVAVCIESSSSRKIIRNNYLYFSNYIKTYTFNMFLGKRNFLDTLLSWSTLQKRKGKMYIPRKTFGCSYFFRCYARKPFGSWLALNKYVSLVCISTYRA